MGAVLSALFTIAMIVVVLAVQTAWALWRGKQPFKVAHSGITITIDPNTGAVQLHDHPTQQQIDAIYAWLHDDWHGILNSRYKWRILRPW